MNPTLQKSEMKLRESSDLTEETQPKKGSVCNL